MPGTPRPGMFSQGTTINQPIHHMLTILIISAVVGGTVGIVAANTCDANSKFGKSASRTKKYAKDCADIVGEATVKLNDVSKEYAKDIVEILKEEKPAKATTKAQAKA